MVILEETLKKMGFGEDLEECQLAFKFAFLMDKKELIESVDFFDLTEERVIDWYRINTDSRLYKIVK